MMYLKDTQKRELKKSSRHEKGGSMRKDIKKVLKRWEDWEAKLKTIRVSGYPQIGIDLTNEAVMIWFKKYYETSLLASYEHRSTKELIKAVDAAVDKLVAEYKNDPATDQGIQSQE